MKKHHLGILSGILALAFPADGSAQVAYNFTNASGSTFTNGYVLSGTMATNALNAVTSANLSISTNGGTPITFTSLPTESGTYTRSICGSSTTFQEYRFGNGLANTLYLDVMGSNPSAPFAGDINGVHTSLLLGSGSYGLTSGCSAQTMALLQNAKSGPYSNMTQNAAAVVNANAGAFNISASTNTAVPRLVNTITSNLTLFTNSIGTFFQQRLTSISNAIQKKQDEKAAAAIMKKVMTPEAIATINKEAARSLANYVNSRKAAGLPLPTQAEVDAQRRANVYLLTEQLFYSEAKKQGFDSAKALRITRSQRETFKNIAGIGKSSGDEEAFGDTESIADNTGVWVQPFASFARQNQLNNISPYTANTSGLVAGVDHKIDANWTFGGAVTYANNYTSSTIADAGNSMVTNMYQISAYGQYALDEASNVQFTAGIGVNQNNGSRITPDNSTASARYNSIPINLGLSLNHAMELNEQTTFSPSLSANWMSINNNQINETGAGNWNLTTQSNNTNQLQFNLNGALEHALDEAWSVNGVLGAGYAAINPSMTLVSSFAGASSSTFTSTGNALAPWMANGGVGVKYSTEAGHALFVNYDAQIREGFLNQTASAKFKYAF